MNERLSAVRQFIFHDLTPRVTPTAADPPRDLHGGHVG